MRRWMAVALQVLVLVVWGYAAFTAEQASVAADAESANDRATAQAASPSERRNGSTAKPG
jgi:hypothetical protein